MDTEQYQPQETQPTVSSPQEKRPKIETGRDEASERNLFYYRFSDLIGDTTEALEEALAKLQGERIDRRQMDFIDIINLNMAKYNIAFELLMRKNPEARALRDALHAIGLRKIAAQKQWEKEILATEGEEGLKKRKQNGEGPGNQYTHEELDMRVRLVQAEVEAGIKPPSSLKYATEVRDAGGFYQWEKEFKRKNREEFMQQLTAAGDPEIATVRQNIFKLNENEYGKDYAEQQNAILAELATIASQKASPPTPATAD
jgi:hypothetical protein